MTIFVFKKWNAGRKWVKKPRNNLHANYAIERVHDGFERVFSSRFNRKPFN